MMGDLHYILFSSNLSFEILHLLLFLLPQCLFLLKIGCATLYPPVVDSLTTLIKSSISPTSECRNFNLNKPKNLSGVNLVWPATINEYVILSCKLLAMRHARYMIIALFLRSEERRV